MSKLLARFWQDDEGSIISVELILVIAILIFGIIPGLVALRNGVVATLTNLANEALKDSINIPPTIHVDQGTPIVVFVRRDLDFSGLYPNPVKQEAWRLARGGKPLLEVNPTPTPLVIPPEPYVMPAPSIVPPTSPSPIVRKP